MVIKRLTGCGKDRLFPSFSDSIHLILSPISSPFPHRSPLLLVPIHWCCSLCSHLYSQQSLTKGKEKLDGGVRERQGDVWCECTGEKLIRLELYKSLRKVTLWRRTRRSAWLTPWRKPGPKAFHMQRPFLCASVR